MNIDFGYCHRIISTSRTMEKIIYSPSSTFQVTLRLYYHWIHQCQPLPLVFGRVGTAVRPEWSNTCIAIYWSCLRAGVQSKIKTSLARLPKRKNASSTYPMPSPFSRRWESRPTDKKRTLTRMNRQEGIMCSLVEGWIKYRCIIIQLYKIFTFSSIIPHILCTSSSTYPVWCVAFVARVLIESGPSPLWIA